MVSDRSVVVPPGGDQDQTLSWAQGLGVGWIKQQIQWHTVEHGPDDFEWQNLDQLVAGADHSGFRVLLGVIHAPDWTRAVQLESGPPADYAEFGRFIEQLAQRYRGHIEAYELWNEPNLAREWRGDTLDMSPVRVPMRSPSRGVKPMEVSTDFP